ncbi:hypothetical protein NDU88_011278 [Pleurodeles waltl]|uniref:Uncharacterized protein n=1 Tax=Pleurodeles waltl TaxID=8319 RepID=A0AAV7R0Y1_PLEWA|nr:hypothetical protein NDU88_011278 [Pleurodeles waltl]
MQERTPQYFREDKGTVASQCILWEAFKMVLRGHAQASIGGIRKERILQCIALEMEIATFEAEVLSVGQPSPEQSHRLQLRQQEL